MILIVGLGNPGEKYSRTRHNIGHRVIDAFPQEDGFTVKKTDVFMNESGKAVKKLIQNSKFSAQGGSASGGKYQNLWIIHDDIDLPIGEFRMQKGRGSAGHKGVESVIKELGTKDFWRVRIGIYPKEGKPKNVEKFVLQNFTKEEEETLGKIIPDIIQAIKTRLVEIC